MWRLVNRTPYAAERCFARDREGVEVWVVAVKATYGLRPGSAPRLEDEQQPVHLAPEFHGEPERSSLRRETDFQPFKPGSDILLLGQAHAPGGKPTRVLDVHLRVGSMARTLRVFGNRFWTRRVGLTLSAPEPFERMPLLYENAFGGVDVDPGSGKQAWEPRNPVGTGFAMEPRRLVDQRAPNIEHPEHLINSWKDRPPPAGFGPICRHWSPRLELAGTHDSNWERDRQPLVPADFDDRFYFCAPQEQQVPGFLWGGEPVILTHLSPHGELRFTLPRVWLTFSTRLGSERVEHRARIHTVTFEPDVPRVTVTWVTSLPCHPSLGLVLGLPVQRPGMPPALAEVLSGQLRQQLESRWRLSRVECILADHAAGLMALQRAWTWLQEGRVELCLAGGVDSYMAPETLEWLDAHARLKSSTHRWGFVPGEAAGFCLLTTRSGVTRHRLEPLLGVAAISTAREQPAQPPRPPGLGLALTRVMREVLQRLPADARVAQVFCDLNGERIRADEYGFTLARVRERLADTSTTWTPADCWGDVGAASGPLFVCLTAASGQRGYARGPLALAWTSSPGGERCAALLSLPQLQRRD